MAKKSTTQFLKETTTRFKDRYAALTEAVLKAINSVAVIIANTIGEAEKAGTFHGRAGVCPKGRPNVLIGVAEEDAGSEHLVKDMTGKVAKGEAFRVQVRAGTFVLVGTDTVVTAEHVADGPVVAERICTSFGSDSRLSGHDQVWKHLRHAAGIDPVLAMLAVAVQFILASRNIVGSGTPNAVRTVGETTAAKAEPVAAAETVADAWALLGM